MNIILYILYKFGGRIRAELGQHSLTPGQASLFELVSLMGQKEGITIVFVQEDSLHPLGLYAATAPNPSTPPSSQQ